MWSIPNCYIFLASDQPSPEHVGSLLRSTQIPTRRDRNAQRGMPGSGCTDEHGREKGDHELQRPKGGKAPLPQTRSCDLMRPRQSPAFASLYGSKHNRIDQEGSPSFRPQPVSPVLSLIRTLGQAGVRSRPLHASVHAGPGLMLESNRDGLLFLSCFRSS